MRKLRLDLDALTVESFDTVQRDRQRGTVVGHTEFPNTRDDPTCFFGTCMETCPQQCSYVSDCAGGSCLQTECCTAHDTECIAETCWETCLTRCNKTCNILEC